MESRKKLSFLQQPESKHFNETEKLMVIETSIARKSISLSLMQNAHNFVNMANAEERKRYRMKYCFSVDFLLGKISIQKRFDFQLSFVQKKT